MAQRPRPIDTEAPARGNDPAIDLDDRPDLRRPAGDDPEILDGAPPQRPDRFESGDPGAGAGTSHTDALNSALGREQPAPPGGADGPSPDLTGGNAADVDVDLTGGPVRPDGGEVPFDADDPFATPDVGAGNLSEHEQSMVDELGADPLADPFGLDQGVPGEYDLSGNETGDDTDDDDDGNWLLDWFRDLANSGKKPGAEVEASQGNPFPDHHWDPESGSWMPNTPTSGPSDGGTADSDGDGGTDGGPGEGTQDGDGDMTQLLPQRIAASKDEPGVLETLWNDWFGSDAKEQPQDGSPPDGDTPPDDGTQPEGGTQPDDGTQPGGGEPGATTGGEGGQDPPPDAGAPAEDRAPDSVWGPKSPSHDASIGADYFEQQQAAEGGGEIQWSDTPRDGGGQPADYDGIDYGDEHNDPYISREAAEAMLVGDPMTDPDVDPIDFTDTGEYGDTDDSSAIAAQTDLTID